MQIFSDPIFIRTIIAIGVTILWIITCWVAYIYGHRSGYTECMNNVRAKRRTRRKLTQNGGIRVLNPVEQRKKKEGSNV